MTMKILNSTIGHALHQLFPENVAFTIASFLVEDLEEQMTTYKLMCAKLYGKMMKGKKEKFDRYCNNLRYDAFFAYSYDTEVIQLNWKNRTAKRLGKWSKTTSTHMNYAMRLLDMSYDFKEIK